MSASKQIFVFSFIILFCASCGQDYDESVVAGVRVGQSTQIQERRLFPNERNIALRICESYRSKWVEFRLSKIGETFEYSYNEKTCESSEQKIDPLKLKLIQFSTQDQQPLIFEGDEFVNFVPSMQTHEHGDLSLICDPLMKRGETPSNVFEKDGNLIKFVFREGEETDSYTVYTIDAKDSSNTITAQDNFEVLTRPEQSSQNELKGLVVFSERVRKCSDEGTEPFATFSQRYND